MKYISLGEKKKGRYVKKEEISLTKLKSLFDRMYIKYPYVKNDSLVSFLLGKQSIYEEKKKSYEQGINDFKNELLNFISTTIDKDKKSKKVLK
jgi:hypothetical protein